MSTTAEEYREKRNSWPKWRQDLDAAIRINAGLENDSVHFSARKLVLLLDALEAAERENKTHILLRGKAEGNAHQLERERDEAVALLRYEGCCTCIGPLDNDESAQPAALSALRLPRQARSPSMTDFATWLRDE